MLICIKHYRLAQACNHLEGVLSAQCHIQHTINTSTGDADQIISCSSNLCQFEQVMTNSSCANFCSDATNSWSI